MKSMINKARVFIVIFLFSMIIGSPFVIKQVIAKKVQEIQSSKEIAEIDNNENSNDNIETVENKEEENKTSNSKKIDIKFEKVDKSYFDDALFIGDSRTDGISEYGGLDNATFFADTGLNIYDIYDTSVSVNNKNVKIEQLLSTNKYGKIYVMMGINELGYNLDRTAKKYEEFINFIKGKQKNSIIYIEANLHVTKAKSESDKTFNNQRINKYNEKIRKFSDNKNIFYLDINDYFDDEEHNLNAKYTHDNIHVYAKYYKEWTNWLKEHAIKVN